MIINSILSLAFLWSCRKCLIHLKELGILSSKIASTSAIPVAEALNNIKNLPIGKKVFMIIRGLVKIKNRVKGQNSIYSLFQETPIKATKLSEYLRRGSWNDLVGKSFWRQPFSLKKLNFELQDMNKNGTLEIRGIKKSALTGALTEVFKNTEKQPKSSNILIRLLSELYNYFVSMTPLGYALSPTAIGSQITLHSVQDGQYVLVMGQFQRSPDGIIFCSFPKYITKQVGYIKSKLRKRYNRLLLITFLLTILLGITGYKVAKQIWDKIIEWRNKQLSKQENEEEERSQDEGQNCNCALCYVNVRTIIFKPCRHYAVCKYCYQQLAPSASCPFCKKPIQGIIEVSKVK